MVDEEQGSTVFRQAKEQLAELTVFLSTKACTTHKLSLSLCRKSGQGMTFDKIIEDGRLWAVRYDGDADNILSVLFNQWNDVLWLRTFFKENIGDLTSHFKITDANQAIRDTLEESDKIERLIMDISPKADLEKLFRPLNNSRTTDMLLGKEKARLKERIKQHPSWLRIYALKLTSGIYIITGGAIKLTATMQERKHTLTELQKLEKVRNFLISENIIDNDSFIEYLSELK